MHLTSDSKAAKSGRQIAEQVISIAHLKTIQAVDWESYILIVFSTKRLSQAKVNGFLISRQVLL